MPLSSLQIPGPVCYFFLLQFIVILVSTVEPQSTSDSFFLSFFFVSHYSGLVMSLFLSESYSKGRRKAAVCHRACNAFTGSSEWYSYLFQSRFAVFVTVLSGNAMTSSYNLSNLMWHSSRYVTSSYKSSYITLMKVCCTCWCYVSRRIELFTEIVLSRFVGLSISTFSVFVTSIDVTH